MIHEIIVKKMGYKLFFVESVCDDPKIIEQNIMVSLVFPLKIPKFSFFGSSPHTATVGAGFCLICLSIHRSKLMCYHNALSESFNILTPL